MSLSSTIRTGMYGAMQPVRRSTLTVDAQDIVVSGLDSVSDGDYFVIVNVKGAAEGNYFRMYINGDTTAANYYNIHGRYLNSTTASSVHWTDAYISYVYNGGFTECRGWLTRKAVSGHVIGTMTGRYDDAATNVTSTQNSIWYKSSASINTITVKHPVAAGFAAGSYVEVYKIGAPGSDVGSLIGYGYGESATAVNDTTGFDWGSNTAPAITDGTDVGISVSYTPKYASSLLEIEFTPAYYTHSANTQTCAFFIFEGSTCIASTFATAVDVATRTTKAPIVKRVKAAGSTSPRIYTARFAIFPGTGTGYLNSLAGTNYFASTDLMTLTVKEIKQ